MGAAQVGAHAAGAAHVGAHAAGAAQVGAQPPHAGAQQRLFLHLSRTLQHQSRKLCFFTLQPQPPQAGAGAQQLGAHAAGAAHVGAHGAGAAHAGAGAAHAGAHAAGAAHDGAGQAHEGAGAQQLGAAPQQPLCLLNRPASALFRPAKATSAAVNHTNFISNLLYILETVGEREAARPSSARNDRRAERRLSQACA